jgi:hypothetical protein
VMHRINVVIGVLTVLALLLLAVVPATAAHNNGNGNNGNNHNGHGFGNGGVTQAPTETFVSGSNTNNAGSVTGGGDNSNTCAAQENFNNSGGVLNQPSIQQYASDIGTGVVFGGPSFTNAPTQSAPCTPSVQQSASSSSK